MHYARGHMRTFRYQLCDVFTDRPLAGNALAVFTDARAMDDATMQALAREMNLSECAFVLRPTVPEAQARIRIFTPTMELPFAGHPALGSAFVLAGPLEREVMRLETGRGIVDFRFEREGVRIAFVWMTQPLPRPMPFAAGAELLAALGVAGSELPIEGHDNGPQHVFVALPTPEAVAALRPDLARLAALGPLAVSVFAPNGKRWKTRVFAPGEGIPEDPATGAAAGPLAVHLARHGRIAFGDEIVIEQGAEIGRPSTLYARASGSAERIERIEVGGCAVMVARGEFRLP
jgi:trans-2,3-dihydro-3-hydroxyanthranilate isomerase